MRFSIKILLVFSFLTIILAEEKYILTDGTVVQGEVITESELSITLKTKYGEITIKKSDLLQLEYEVQLNSGEKFRGLKISDTADEIIIKTNMGELSIQKSEILDIKEIDKITSLGEVKLTEKIERRRPYSIADMLFGSGSGYRNMNKNSEFALGEEKLIDTFFDPTANVLEEGVLYLSGLSFAFGLSEKLQISSRWSDFSFGNFNIRPKYQIFKKGNWEKESALSIGGHFHTYWKPDKIEWQSGITEVCNEYSQDHNGNNSSSCDKVSKYYGGYFPLGATIEGNDDYYSDGKLAVSNTDDLDYMFEFFTAYTFSKARKGMKGRISSTVGALVQIPLNYDVNPYRIYGSLDLDITPQLKLIGEAFYDPFYLDITSRSESDDCFFLECLFEKENYRYKTSDKAVTNSGVPVTKDDFKSIRPIHFDFGFMYAVNEHFRIGIHNQPYILAFYWKF
tara:strand:- start:1889 stop:3244 length:1356 start_codon:yes stop_codon:yes gene_type:complete